MTARFTVTLLFALAFATACPPPPVADAGPVADDAGATLADDAGATLDDDAGATDDDAGATPDDDAGATDDAGVSDDGGVNVDGCVNVDGGASVDGGVANDGGVNVDGGANVDAGGDVDGGATADAGAVDGGPALVVVATEPLVVTEQGDTATFTVRLATPPAANVDVGVSSTVDVEALVTSLATLTFTTSDWFQPQTVIVTGQDDGDFDGAQSFAITVGPVTSNDAAYDGRTPASVDGTNLDDEGAGLGFAFESPPPRPYVTEAGRTIDVRVTLATAPYSPVLVTFSTEGDTTVDPPTLTLNATNWSAGLVATVSGVDDDISEDVEIEDVTVDSSSSTDPIYDEIAPHALSVLVLDEDALACVAAPVAWDSGELPSGIDVSDDGRYVAFSSSATNVVPSDTNGQEDVFVVDMQSDTVVRASVDATGAQASGASARPTISDDGRYVAFESNAANLVGGDANAAVDVFVKDLLTGAIERASLAPGGAEIAGPSLDAHISGDGTRVAFVSSCGSGLPDRICWRDLAGDATTLVTIGTVGEAANGVSSAPSITYDGAHVAFLSNADNLVANDTDLSTTLFVADVPGASIVAWSPVTVEAFGVTSTAISGDGNVVAFDTIDALDGSSDQNGVRDVYVMTTPTSTPALVSVGVNGANGDDRSDQMQISYDGLRVAFVSRAGNFGVPGHGAVEDAYVRDLLDQSTTWVTVDPYRAGNWTLSPIALGADGDVVAFAGAGTPPPGCAFVWSWTRPPAN